METKLSGKKALVTGGFSGIGLSIATALAGEGADVAVASRHPDPGVVADLESYGVRAVGIAADVSQQASVRKMVEESVDALGGLDLYVNNAARAIHQSVTEIDADTCQTIVDTNLMGCLWGCQAAAKQMISRGGGAILIVGSTSMYTPGPTETIYRMSKSALKPLTVSLAIELAPHNIRANLLIPGYYQTRLTAGISPDIEKALLEEIPLRRAGETRECANAAVFLLSDSLSSYTTGAELLVDGGISMRPLSFSSYDELKNLNQAD